MKPAKFEFARARSLGEAATIVRQAAGSARVIAGGQSLGPMLNLRLVQPSVLVDITAIPELTRIEDDGDGVMIGACVTTSDLEDGRARVDVARVEAAIQRRTLLYDKAGEEHYNLISALHKSMRNSDPDAALYWLARMLEAGEDPLYVARRMVRFASEDIGNADPHALVLAMAVKDAVHFIGMPEGGLALAQLATYLAAAPKSNAAYKGYGEAVREVVELMEATTKWVR